MIQHSTCVAAIKENEQWENCPNHGGSSVFFSWSSTGRRSYQKPKPSPEGNAVLEQNTEWWGRSSDIHLRPLPQHTLAVAPAASHHLSLGRSSLQLTASLHDWAADKVFHRATATFSVITRDCSILKDDDLFEPRLKTGRCHGCVLCPRRSKWSSDWNRQLIYQLLIFSPPLPHLRAEYLLYHCYILYFMHCV